MKITPIDIRQQQFRRSLRGLDQREVDTFLNLVSDELESVQRDNNRLKETMLRNQRVIEEFQERERTLKETMVTAQRISEDIKEGARKEADVILSRAEIQAEKIIAAASERLVGVIEDINEMKRQREQLRANMVSTIEAHRKLLREVNEERAEAAFMGVEELKQRRARLHAQLQELLESQANLLGLDRDREVEDLHEEVERLRGQQVILLSRIQGSLDTHKRLLEVRDEADLQSGGARVEDTLRLLRKGEPKKIEAVEPPKVQPKTAGQAAS